MKSIILVLLGVSILIVNSACSSTKDATTNSTLQISSSSETTSSNLQITIPKGWTEIKDNFEQLFDIWLVNDSKNAAIVFVPIYISENVDIADEQKKIELIKDIVINKRKNEVNTFEIIDENFEGGMYNMHSSKLNVDDKIQNSVIFGKGKYFFECLAYFDNGYSPSTDELNKLAETQFEILKDLQIK